MTDAADRRCPECGEPNDRIATYCRHCSADLAEARPTARDEADGVLFRARDSLAAAIDDWTDRSDDGTDRAADRGDRSDGRVVGGTRGSTGAKRYGSTSLDRDDERLLDPDGVVDNTLTAVVGIVGGLVVGIVGSIVLGVVTQSGWGYLLGVVAWLGSTAYLVRRRTVQGAISATGYAVTIVLLSVPVIALSPLVAVDGGASERGGTFLVLLVFVAVPAAIAAAVGWVASRYVPDDARGSEG